MTNTPEATPPVAPTQGPITRGVESTGRGLFWAIGKVSGFVRDRVVNALGLGINLVRLPVGGAVDVAKGALHTGITTLKTGYEQTRAVLMNTRSRLEACVGSVINLIPGGRAVVDAAHSVYDGATGNVDSGTPAAA